MRHEKNQITRVKKKKKQEIKNFYLLKSSNLRQMKPKNFANVSDLITQNEEISGFLNRLISNKRFINISQRNRRPSTVVLTPRLKSALLLHLACLPLTSQPHKSSDCVLLHQVEKAINYVYKTSLFRCWQVADVHAKSSGGNHKMSDGFLLCKFGIWILSTETCG